MYFHWISETFYCTVEYITGKRFRAFVVSSVDTEAKSLPIDFTQLCYVFKPILSGSVPALLFEYYFLYLELPNEFRQERDISM
jgi:hypothetical protein